MNKKNTIIFLLVALVVTIIKSIFLVPVEFYGGITGGYVGRGYITLFRLVSPRNFINHLLVGRFIFESIIIYVVTFILFVIINKYRKNRK